MSDAIKTHHEKEMEGIGLPEWAKLECPYCNATLPLRSVRGIGMKFNARNLGDVTIEVCCDKCRVLNTVYFHEACPSVADFVKALAGESYIDKEPVIEEDMYKMSYNNLVTRMILGGYGAEEFGVPQGEQGKLDDATDSKDST